MLDVIRATLVKQSNYLMSADESNVVRLTTPPGESFESGVHPLRDPAFAFGTVGETPTSTRTVRSDFRHNAPTCPEPRRWAAFARGSKALGAR